MLLENRVSGRLPVLSFVVKTTFKERVIYIFFLTDMSQDISRIFFNKAKVRKSMAIPSKFDMAQARGSDKSGP
jgi:hypothetical protein